MRSLVIALPGRLEVLSPTEHAFVERHRVARLATADRNAGPHVVPVCFGLSGDTLYIAIDAKPKRGPPNALKRLRNIAANPQVAVVVDRYEEDWRHLGWVMMRGPAELLTEGDEHSRAQALVRARYTQLAAMNLDGLPVIAIRIAKVTSWGDLT